VLNYEYQIEEWLMVSIPGHPIITNYLNDVNNRFVTLEIAGYNSDTERELFAGIGAVHRPRRDEAQGHKTKGTPSDVRPRQ
jgi:hypothetical protein